MFTKSQIELASNLIIAMIIGRMGYRYHLDGDSITSLLCFGGAIFVAVARIIQYRKGMLS